MAIFTGFKPTGLKKIANRLGYEGSLDNFENYLDQNPEKKRQMLVYEESAKRMARGGVVRMQEGGTPTSITNIGDMPEYGGPAPMPTPEEKEELRKKFGCLLYTSPSPRDVEESRMPSSA